MAEGQRSSRNYEESPDDYISGLTHAPFPVMRMAITCSYVGSLSFSSAILTILSVWLVPSIITYFEDFRSRC
jgi:hypothetical protein